MYLNSVKNEIYILLSKIQRLQTVIENNDLAELNKSKFQKIK